MNDNGFRRAQQMYDAQEPPFNDESMSCKNCLYRGPHIAEDCYECLIDEGPTSEQARLDAQTIEEGYCDRWQLRTE